MARHKRDRSEIESWLALREREGVSLREVAERSGIPMGTLAFWSHKLRCAQASSGFVEARIAKASAQLPAQESGELLVRFASGGSVELRGELAERVAAKILEHVTQWS